MVNKQHRLHSSIALFLMMLSLVYLVLGFHGLVVKENGAFDLKFRWLSQLCLHSGAIPNDSYPPWSYAISEVLVPSFEWSWVRGYFAGLHVVAIGLFVTWANSRLSDGNSWDKLIISCCALAISGFAVCLRLGQFSILILAFLIGMIWFLEKERPALAGLMLGCALIKPQLSLLFCLIPLVKRQWSCLLVASLFLLLLTVFVCYGTRRSFGEFFSFMQGSIGHYQEVTRLGYFNFLRHYGCSFQTVFFMGVIIGGLLAVLLCWKYRYHSYTTLAAVCAVLSLNWSYSRRYDHVLLAFLLVPLTSFVLSRRGYLDWIVFMAVGLSVWMPVSESQWQGVLPYVIETIWIAGLSYLLLVPGLARGRSNEASSSSISHPPMQPPCENLNQFAAKAIAGIRGLS